MVFVLWEVAQTGAIAYVLWRLAGVQSKKITLLVDRAGARDRSQ